MGFFRPSRTGQADRWFEWKVRVFLAGAGLGLVGIFLDDHRVVVAALVVLTVGVVLRFLPAESARPAGSVGDEEDEEDGDENGEDAGGVAAGHGP